MAKMNLTVKQFLEMGLLGGSTHIIIFTKESESVASGRCFSNQIMRHENDVINSFTWFDSDTVAISLDC